MRILVTGSREWDDRAMIYRALADARGDTPHDQMMIVVGDARGADRIAVRYAMDMDWGLDIHRAAWGIQGKAAGIIRNIGMVDTGADICLAFIKDNSPGATHCADYAESKGIPVKRYRA
jgi:hypothetical protein